MNRYGRLAMEHWQKTDPAWYGTIADPREFFTELGEQVEAEIQELEIALAGPDKPDERYLEKVGRLRMARLAAEEQVLGEMVLIPEPEREADRGEESWEGMELIRDLNAIAFSLPSARMRSASFDARSRRIPCRYTRRVNAGSVCPS